MRFALLGDHPDGMAMARALVESGRHELIVFSGSGLAREHLARQGLQAELVGDLEEVLANPRVEAVIIASSPTLRPGQLRRALQAERHVLSVQPADQTPDLGFEAGLIQKDLDLVLLPILTEWLHPGLAKLREQMRSARADGTFRCLEIERWNNESILLDAESPNIEPCFPGWDLLRYLGGEVAEVTGLSKGEEPTSVDVILIGGLFVEGGLFQVSLIPGQSEAHQRVALVTSSGRAELIFPQGWPGPAQLQQLDETGQARIESWPALSPWPELVERFDEELVRRAKTNHSLAQPSPRLTWLDAQRGLELDDAVRRSVSKRRVTQLEFQEGTEEASFKGTMTLLGCGILWLSLALLIASIWAPWLGWFILPAIGAFLVMQFLGLAVKREEKK